MMNDRKIKLTVKETKILELMMLGKSNKEIAVEMNIKHRTVTQYTVILYRKLGVDNRAQAVATYINKVVKSSTDIHLLCDIMIAQIIDFNTDYVEQSVNLTIKDKLYQVTIVLDKIGS